MAFKVEFKKSGKKAEWNSKYESILELAEDQGIDIESACREGYCGTCMVKLSSGEVQMSSDDGLDEADRQKGMILSCSAVPISDIVIEA
jgi:ferredoxin